jgi:DNA-binding MarR family transcriptional regulator
MNRTDKLSFIFETGKRFRLVLHENVMSQDRKTPSICEELSAIQMNTAMQVRLHQPMSLNELATKLGISPPSASVMIDRLVEKNIITRSPDPSDRRKVELRIHPEAEKAMNDMHQRFYDEFDRIARQMGNTTINHWFDVMQQVDRILQEESK